MDKIKILKLKKISANKFHCEFYLQNNELDDEIKNFIIDKVKEKIPNIYGETPNKETFFLKEIVFEIADIYKFDSHRFINNIAYSAYVCNVKFEIKIPENIKEGVKNQYSNIYINTDNGDDAFYQDDDRYSFEDRDFSVAEFVRLSDHRDGYHSDYINNFFDLKKKYSLEDIFEVDTISTKINYSNNYEKFKYNVKVDVTPITNYIIHYTLELRFSNGYKFIREFKTDLLECFKEDINKRIKNVIYEIFSKEGVFKDNETPLYNIYESPENKNLFYFYSDKDIEVKFIENINIHEKNREYLTSIIEKRKDERENLKNEIEIKIKNILENIKNINRVDDLEKIVKELNTLIYYQKEMMK